MGLGNLITRNLTYTVTGSGTHANLPAQSFQVITDGGPGAWPDWLSAGPYEGAMSVPGCWRAAILLSELVGAVPYHAYRDGPDDTPRRIDPTPSVLEQPAPPETRMSTISAWCLDLMWHGNAVGLIVARNRDRWPTAILPVSAKYVGVKRAEPRDRLPVPNGTVIYWLGDRWYSSEDVVHVKGPAEPGALRGFGLLEAQLGTTVKLAQDLGEQARGVADHAVPSMVVKSLTPDLTPTEAAELKAAVMTAQRTRQPLALNATTEVEPLSWNPTETQLIEARQLSLVEQALIFGLDPMWLGSAQTSRVYSNVETEAINLLRYSAGGHLARIEQTLSGILPRGVWVEANLDSRLRPDTLTRFRAHALAIGSWATADEIRRLERMPRLTPVQRKELEAAKAAAATQPRPNIGPDNPTEDAA